MEIINQYEKENYKITEYTKDGINVSHIIKTPIPIETIDQEVETTIEEQILAENQYQTALLEIQMLGGM